MLKYPGTIWSLKRLTWDAGVRGSWTKPSDQEWRFDWNGAVLKFWPRTHTVLFQGQEWAAKELKKRLLNYAEDNDMDGFIEVPAKKQKFHHYIGEHRPSAEAVPTRFSSRPEIIEADWEEVREEGAHAQNSAMLPGRRSLR